MIRSRIINISLVKICPLVFLMLILLGETGKTQIPENLTGNLDIAYNRTDTDAEITKTLDQDYNVNWQKYFTRYLVTRASFKYFNLGIDRNVNSNVWRSELQPAGEIALDHPDFAVSSTYRRRVSKSDISETNLTRDNYSVTFKTKMIEYPFINIRFDKDHSFNPQYKSMRDLSENRFTLSSIYDYQNNDFEYSFSRRFTENKISGLKATSYNHVFRWFRMMRFKDNRLRVSTNYNFNYRSEKDEKPDSTVVFDIISFQQSLYAFDATPDFGALDTLITLGDGSVTNPTQPFIDIGRANPDHNLGIDFGFARLVSALYLYTDRISANTVSWRVYISEDNINWELYNTAPSVTFDLVYNRYEIIFDDVTTRYIKIVNGGVNFDDNVYVTEIQALIRKDFDREYKKSSTSHLIDVNTTYKINKKTEASADLSYLNQPGGSFEGRNQEIYLTLTSKYQPTTKLTHNVKLQNGYRDYDLASDNFRNLSLMYSLLYSPLPTLDFSLSLFHNDNFTSGDKTQENNNAFLQAYGNILKTLNATIEIGVSRNNQFLSNQRFDTWNFRTSLDGNLTRRIDYIATFMHQLVQNVDNDDSRSKNQYGVSFNYRMTNTIFIRGRMDVLDDARTYVSHEYNISWNILPRLSIGALILTNDWGDDTTERYNLYANYTIRSRASIYFNYVDNKYEQNGGLNSTSLQIGFKTGF